MIQGLYSALSGLNANKIAIDITSNNISNANTDGYTKQRVNFSDNPIHDVNNASMIVKEGSGSHVQSVVRIEDQFLYNRMTKAKADFENNNTQYKTLNELNNTLQKPEFTNMYDLMFESLNRYAESPHNLTLKHIAETNANNLITKADEIHNVFNSVKKSNTQESSLLLKELPTLKESLDKVSLQIKVEESSNKFTVDKTYANSLRDRKDVLDTQIKIKEAKILGFKNSNNIIDTVSKLFQDSFAQSYINVDTYLKSNQTGKDANVLISKEAEIRNRF